MQYYAFIENEKLNGAGQLKRLDDNVQNIEITEEVFNNISKYMYSDGEVILNPNYEAEQGQKEKERIGNLTCTKRVFALMLQELGVDYITVLLPLIESNSQAKLEWDLCVELERKNPLLDIMALQLGITSEQLDGLFRYANGEITIEQFREIPTVSEMEIIEEPVVNNSESVGEVNSDTDEVIKEEIVNNEN